MKRNKNIGSMLLATLLMIAGVSIGLAQSSANYDIIQSVLSGGGGNSTSSSYNLDAAIGQQTAETSSSSSYSMTNGLFSGAAPDNLINDNHAAYLPLLVK